MREKSIDIIIPIYNQEKYLKRCLDSILKQSDNSITVILVNDGSTDNSLNICREYAQKYENIKIVDKENGGASSARNAGLDIAEGEYVCFIDPDDYVSDDYILWVKENANDSEIAVCSYIVKHIDFGEQKVSLKSGEFSVKDALFLLEETGLFNSPCNKIYSRKIIESEPKLRFGINQEPGEDLLFNCSYFARINKVNMTENAYYYYMRNGEDSLANTFRKDLWEKNKVFIGAIEELYKTLGLNADESNKTLSLAVIRYVHSAIPNMYRKKHKFSKSERLAFYNEIINSDKFTFYFKNLSTTESLLMNLKKTYSKGSAKKMDAHYSFLMFIRNNFSPLYNFLRKLKSR